MARLGVFEIQFVFMDGDIAIFICCLKYAFGLVIYEFFFLKNESRRNTCRFRCNMIIFYQFMRCLWWCHWCAKKNKRQRCELLKTEKTNTFDVKEYV